MVMRPRSGASVPARTCISVDLPAPLWPTRPDAFAGADGEVDAVKRADGAEMLFDAVQLDDDRVRASAIVGRLSDDIAGDAARARNHFMLALMAAMASSCVYSWLATPPSRSSAGPPRNRPG